MGDLHRSRRCRGLSRLFGGIHFEQGDFNGRALGDYVGTNAFDAAQAYFDGMAMV